MRRSAATGRLSFLRKIADRGSSPQRFPAPHQDAPAPRNRARSTSCCQETYVFKHKSFVLQHLR